MGNEDTLTGFPIRQVCLKTLDGVDSGSLLYYLGHPQFKVIAISKITHNVLFCRYVLGCSGSDCFVEDGA